MDGASWKRKCAGPLTITLILIPAGAIGLLVSATAALCWIETEVRPPGLDRKTVVKYAGGTA
jgi:hypothetical protein